MYVENNSMFGINIPSECKHITDWRSKWSEIKLKRECKAILILRFLINHHMVYSEKRGEYIQNYQNFSMVIQSLVRNE